MSNHLDTLLAHAGTPPDSGTGAVIPPIHLSTTFKRRADYEPGPFLYSRVDNPTRQQFESVMARLEGAASAYAFSSGMAAIAAVFQLLPPGSHVLLPHVLYFGVRQLLDDVMGRGRIRTSYVDMSDPAGVEDAFQDETRLIWIETPSNPLLEITDIQQISRMARARDCLVVVDGTWTTPLLQRPLELGADVVVHSVTKYISGHSDVLGGIVALPTESPLNDRLASIQHKGGAVLDPFSSWLAMRGLRTLAVRLERQCDNAEAMAQFLDAHERVRAVHYPGLRSHPNHDLAKHQMKRAGGMLSFEIDGTREEARRIAARCSVLQPATSLGGTESLIEHRTSIEANTPTPDTLIRISAGIEHPDDLLDDLSRSIGG